MPPVQLSRYNIATACRIAQAGRAPLTAAPPPRMQHRSVLLPHPAGTKVAAPSACRCALRLTNGCGLGYQSPVPVRGTSLQPRRCFALFGGSDDDERSMARYNEQRLKLEAVQAASTGWWQRQRNKIYLAYIVQSNDEFDVEEFTEGAGLVFDVLNTAMYCGESVTDKTFHGMVRMQPHAMSFALSASAYTQL